MKRKRSSRAAQQAIKKQKTASQPDLRPSHPLLRKYYVNVVTLRQYLSSRLKKTRRRRLQQYGQDASNSDAAVSQLLDSTLVGTLAPVHVQDESVIVEEDLTVFTQQLSEGVAASSLKPGTFKQSEIVDFVIWLLFRRHQGNSRPRHLLCQNFQRYLNAYSNGKDPEIVPGIPGIYAKGPNVNASTLRVHPWDALPHLLGSSAERILGDLILDCGIFTPVGSSSNMIQLSGIPMCDLTLLHISAGPEPGQDQEIDKRRPKGQQTSNQRRGLSDIRFVRHRMLYSTAPQNDKGCVKFGLNQLHVLSRLRDCSNREETKHIIKYIFPAQFALHNVFTSGVDPKDTAQSFKDYTVREKEILRLKQIRTLKQRLAGKGDKMKPGSLPKRLRGKALDLVQLLRKRHSTCAYVGLLEYYCPLPSKNDSARTSSAQLATSAPQVSAFCRAAVSRVFPKDFWGKAGVGSDNLRVLHRRIDMFVRLRRYESMTLHDVLQDMNVSSIEWLAPPSINGVNRLSATDFAKRKELMAELLYYLFDSFLIPLIRGHFHVTESNVQRNQLFYFRHDVWQKMSEPALATLKQNMLEECSTHTVKKMLAKRSLGVSTVRLLPKEQGMRPIINLRRRVQKLQHGHLVLGQSINSILTPAFSVLKHEKEATPGVLGSALFSVDHMFPRLQAYRQSLIQNGLGGQRLFFAKVDVQACFDTIPQGRLMQLVKNIIGVEYYQIAKYSRAKLTGTLEKNSSGFGSKPSWRFLTKATPGQQAFDFSRETEDDTAEGRAGTIYINGINQRCESRRAIISLLEEHIERNLIKVGKRFYRQKAGIPQGSIVSSLLCSYFYAELEREVLDFANDGNSILLRLIDDFLIISTDRGVAERFVRTMHAGVPEYGVQVKPEKSRVNFEVRVAGKKIEVFGGKEFPYCGHAINTTTLDLSKDWERRRKMNISESITVEYSQLPGQTFYRKTLNTLKLQMHAMLLSTTYNSLPTVLANLRHSFSEVAQKTFQYIKSLPPGKQPAGKLIIRTVDALVRLSCILMHRRRTTKKAEVLSFECSVSDAQAKWLACTAFSTVFGRRQTKFTTFIQWLQSQIESLAISKMSRVEKRMLAEVVSKSSG